MVDETTNWMRRCNPWIRVIEIMAAVAVKDVSSFLSSKQSEESDKDLAGEWAQLEELHNKK